jgi:hypothetical protein
MRVMPGGAAAVLATAAWMAPGTTAAQTAVAVRVDYQAAAGCPGADGFWAELRTRTVRVRAAGPGEPARTFALRISEAPGGYAGNLVTDASDTRAVAGRTCAEVVTALALTTALSVDPEALGAGRPAPVAPPGLAAAPSERRGPVLDAGAEWLRGVLPPDLGGLALGIGFREGAWLAPRLSLHFLGSGENATSVARFRSAAAGADVCSLAVGALALRACAGAQGGALVATGQGLDHPRTATTPWLAATAALRVGWVHRSGLGVGLDGGFTLPLVRPTFIREAPREEVARAEPGFGAALRVLWRLP